MTNDRNGGQKNCLKGLTVVVMVQAMDVQRRGWVHDSPQDALLRHADSASLGREPGVPIFKKSSPPRPLH